MKTRFAVPEELSTYVFRASPQTLRAAMQ